MAVGMGLGSNPLQPNCDASSGRFTQQVLNGRSEPACLTSVGTSYRAESGRQLRLMQNLQCGPVLGWPDFAMIHRCAIASGFRMAHHSVVCQYSQPT